MNREQRPAHNMTFVYDEIENLILRHRKGVFSAKVEAVIDVVWDTKKYMIIP